MTSHRSYRPALAHDIACQELRRCAGAQFDPGMVEAFLASLEADDDEAALGPAQPAAAHVRTLLEAGPPRSAQALCG